VPVSPIDCAPKTAPRDHGNAVQRTLGINAGLAWHRVAHGVVVYIDLGCRRA